MSVWNAGKKKICSYDGVWWKVDIADGFRDSPFNGILDPEFKLGSNEACSDITKIILQSKYSLPENINTLSNHFKTSTNPKPSLTYEIGHKLICPFANICHISYKLHRRVEIKCQLDAT